MKKKLAVLLALCLALGALPLSALAVQYKGTIDSGADQGKEITFDVKDDTGAVSIVSDATLVNQYYLESPKTLTVEERLNDVTFNLSYYGAAPGTLAVNATKFEQVIEDNTINLAPVPDANGNLSTTVDETLAEGIKDVKGTLTLDATTTTTTADEASTAVTMPASVVAAAIEAKIDVKVETNVGTVTLPTAALEKAGENAATLTVKKETAPAPTGVTVAASISITLTGMEGVVLETPIAVELKTTVSNPIAAWLSNGHLYRVRTAPITGGIKLFTRHLSDFVVVAEGTKVDPAPMNAEVGTAGNSTTFTVEDVEPGDSVVVIFNKTVAGVTYQTHQAWHANGTPNVDATQGTKISTPGATVLSAVSVEGDVTFSEDGGFNTGDLTTIMPTTQPEA